MTFPVPTVVLASASPARLTVLKAAGIHPRVSVSRVDEDALLAQAATNYGSLSVADQVLLLAQAKAQDVDDHLAANDGSEIIIGCDSMFDFDGTVHGKPRDAQQATQWWQQMRGSSGVLHTGHWLIDSRDAAHGGTGATLGLTASTTVHFAQISDAEIDSYVATGEPLAVAGACTIDGLGAAFISGVEGDHNSVIGLSVHVLRQLLNEVGVQISSLWKPADVTG